MIRLIRLDRKNMFKSSLVSFKDEFPEYNTQNSVYSHELFYINSFE